MHIISIAAELAPIAKVGGLADVITGLSRELTWKGNDVDIIIPKYDCMNSNAVRDLTIFHHDLMSFYQGEWFSNTIWVGWVENLKVYFIDAHHPRFFFNRACYYGCEDDIERFLYFSRAAMEFMYKKQIRPDIIHLHDWQSAVAAVLYKDMYQPIGFNKSKLVFTIHNIEYQGKCAKEDLNKIGLDGSKYFTADKLQDNQDPKLINLMKGAIVYSDYVTTVSPRYAEEVKTPAQGKGLESTLVAKGNKFSGILNGIDYSYWNPAIDRYLPAHYTERELPLNKDDHATIDKKAFIKNFLREHLDIEQAYRPLVGCVTRLVPQKGTELIKHAIEYVLANNGQFVLLGTSPIPSISAEFYALKHAYKENPNIRIILHVQEDLAHLIYAGSDIFIVPSLFEPCGLTQMIALKYGTIPVVRKTGGLADTVFDIDNNTDPNVVANGYVFDKPDNASLEDALGRALLTWSSDPEKWRHLMTQAMTIDFSWNIPSNFYIQIFNKLMRE